MSESETRAREYSKIKNGLALAEPFYALAVLAALQLTGVSTWIAKAAYETSLNWPIAVAVYALLFGLIYYIAIFWLKFYRGYAVEQRYGLSDQAITGWLKDEIKKIALSAGFLFIFVEFLYLLLRNLPGSWWFFMALGWIFFTIVMVKITPVFIIPLFYKYEKLTDNDLRERLIRLARKCGVRILDIFTLRLSAKTKKANAALTGIGATRRVLLGDTLLANYTKDEVEVVLAHELAHHKLAHIWKLLLAGSAGTLVVFYFVKLSLPVVADVLGLRGIDDVAAFPSILFVLTGAGLFISPLQNAFSRRLESAADSYAIEITAMPGAFVTCMEKLARQNLSDPEPGVFVEMMLYDHPPIYKRIKMAKEIMAKKGGLDGRQDRS